MRRGEVEKEEVRQVRGGEVSESKGIENEECKKSKSSGS